MPYPRIYFPRPIEVQDTGFDPYPHDPVSALSLPNGPLDLTIDQGVVDPSNSKKELVEFIQYRGIDKKLHPGSQGICP
jgi:hypothetical protein